MRKVSYSFVIKFGSQDKYEKFLRLVSDEVTQLSKPKVECEHKYEKIVILVGDQVATSMRKVSYSFVIKFGSQDKYEKILRLVGDEVTPFLKPKVEYENTYEKTLMIVGDQVAPCCTRRLMASLKGRERV